MPFVLLAICKPCIRFRWSLYRFRPKSSHLSSGILGLPSYCHFHHFPSGARICIAYHILHIIHVLHHVACAFLVVDCGSVCLCSWLGLSREMSTWSRTPLSTLTRIKLSTTLRTLQARWPPLEITSISALLVVRSIAMPRYLSLAISCLPYCHVSP